MEAWMCILAVFEHLVAIECHDGLRRGIAKLEREHSHLEEFALGLLTLIALPRCPPLSNDSRL